MFAIRTLFLVALASASLVSCDYATVYNDLQKIYGDTVNVDNAVNNYNGNSNGIAPLYNAFATLDKDVNQTVTDTNATATVNSAQAAQVLNYIRNSAIPITKKALNDMVAKKATFTSGGLCAVVISELNRIRTDTNSLSGALVSKAPTASKSSASVLSASVAGLFNSALTAYGTC